MKSSSSFSIFVYVRLTKAKILQNPMKKSEVVVSWANGLHLRPASKLVRLSRTFRSHIYLKCNDRISNARSVISVLLLCATMGTTIQVEVSGEDEESAMEALHQVFADPK